MLKPAIRDPNTLTQSPEVRAVVTSSYLSWDSLRVFCYCQKSEDFGDMIGCDNKAFPTEGYYLKYLDLKEVPQSKLWFCPECLSADKSVTDN